MKKGLIIVLILANLLMLGIGIVTIPPNLQLREGRVIPLKGSEQKYPDKPSTDKKTPPTVTESDSGKEQKETGVSLSTTERPDLEDFAWYIDDTTTVGILSDAKTIDNISPVTGSWKALIIYDPNNEYDMSAMEFLNISLDGSAESLALTLDWYHIFWANESKFFDETDMEDSIFTGKWENGGLWASGAGTIRIKNFYEQEGKQYALGSMDTPDGIPALVALVRP